MIKEIDLRSLLVGNLKCHRHDVRPYTLYANDNLNYMERPFESFRKWNRVEQTSYIESIFLNCCLQPIVRFQNAGHTVIVDGLNSYETICDFCSGKLILQEKGLKQLKFLAGKSFKDLSELEIEYFKKCESMKVLDYYYENNEKKILTFEEEREIEKYFHLIYNSALRLEIEELQKAQFATDRVTNEIKDKIEKDPSFLNMLEELYLYNGHKKRNKIENILLNCRLLIASTFSNIDQFTSASNNQIRIEENYLPNIEQEDTSKIFQNFYIIISNIYNNLIKTQKWEKYEILHTRPFIEVTYWLISIIQKEKLLNQFEFDFMKYIEYFGEKEEVEKNFSTKQSHYRKNMLNRYFVVAKYFEENYGHSLAKYFEKKEEKQKSQNTIKNIQELAKVRVSAIPITEKVGSFVNELGTSSHNVRPYYQRFETINIALASRILESLLLGIRLPYIIVYDKLENGKIVTEIVDGQQRILSILAYIGKPFCNSQKELEYSIKNGFALKNLRVLSELNNYQVKPSGKKNRTEKILSEKDYQKILNAEIYISKISDTENHMKAIDHYIRLNKNMSTIKENSYRMWILIADQQILDYQNKIAEKYLGSILPKKGSQNSANIILFRLAYLFSKTKEQKEITLSDYKNAKVSSWITEFNLQKDKNIFKNPEKIGELREEYCKEFEKVGDFLEKIKLFLERLDKTIFDLFTLNQAKYPGHYYFYLFVLLKDIPLENILEHKEKIFEIITDFYKKIRAQKLTVSQIKENLEFTLQQVYVYDDSKKREFKETLLRTLR